MRRTTDFATRSRLPNDVHPDPGDERGLGEELGEDDVKLPGKLEALEPCGEEGTDLH